MTNRYINGIDAETGELLTPPPSGAALWERRDELRLPPSESRDLQWWVQYHGLDDPDRLPIFGVDPERLDQAGWAVLYGPSITDTIRSDLAPLVDLRRGQVPSDRFREIDLPAGMTSQAFRTQYKIGFGPAEPEKIPYYLLIVADPREIPFELQYALNVQYAVGRLHFDRAADYGKYAQAIKAIETASRAPRRAALFGVDGNGDEERLLIDALVQPLAQRLQAWQADQPGRPSVEHIAGSGKADLLRVLDPKGGQELPGFLFTAGHGLGCKVDDPTLPQRQGALVCADHQRTGRVTPDSYFAGSDLPDDRDLDGLIAFQFSCYGAGCPSHDDFSQPTLGGTEQIAPYPLVSQLAQRMLACGAQAFVGHIDRAWGASFDLGTARHEGGDGDQIKVFDCAFRQLLSGHRLGHALEWFHQRYAESTSELAGLLRQRFLTPEQSDYLALVRQTALDARNYVIIGDPAVRLVGMRGSLT
jgi:hypothetical protein